MMWVNEIFPPRPRLRWLFITSRLSATSLAGMSRTLVAVGTWRLASMLVTVRAAAPLSGTISSATTGTAISAATGGAVGVGAGAGAGIGAAALTAAGADSLAAVAGVPL